MSLFLFAGIQGFLLSLLIAFHKSSSTSSRILLSALIFLYSYDVVAVELIRSGTDIGGYLIGTVFWLQLSYGPIIYLFVRTRTGKLRLVWKDYIHFIPFILGNLYFLPFILQAPEIKYQALTNTPGMFIRIAWMAELTHFLVYLIISIRHLQKVIATKADIGKVIFRSLKILLVINLIIWIGFTLLTAASFMPGGGLGQPASFILSLVVTVFIYLIGYLGWMTPVAIDSLVNGILVKSKYRRSGLDKERSMQLLARLKEYVETNQVYFDSNLTMKDLATNIGFSPNHISQIINENLEMNFHDFINEYRIKEAQKIIASDSANSNILSIAYDVGFNSKSAFNNAFKKFTGITPSDYKKSMRSVSPESVTNPVH